MDEFVKQVQVAYRQMIPYKSLFEHCKNLSQKLDSPWTCLDCQERIYQNVIDDEHSKKYPPLKSYTTRFLRHYISEIELANDELHEDISEKYVTLIHSSESSTLCYKSYTLAQKVISIQISTQHNEVGMVTWDASFLLAEFAMSHSEYFNEKSVLELGSGVGLLGMIASHFTSPKQIILTDHASPVLQNLIQNLSINGYHEEFSEEKNFQGMHDLSQSTLKESKGKLNNNLVTVKLLEWFGCVEKNSLPSDLPYYDVIIAADVVYDIDLAKIVPQFLSLLFAHNKEAVAFIAVTIRNEATYQLFQSQLQTCNLLHEDFTHLCLPSAIIYERKSVVLLKIYPKC